MNKRIRELANQALAEADKVWNPDTDAGIFFAIAMEKHAELVIQECLNMTDWQTGQEIQTKLGYKDRRWPDAPEPRWPI